MFVALENSAPYHKDISRHPSAVISLGIRHHISRHPSAVIFRGIRYPISKRNPPSNFKTTSAIQFQNGILHPIPKRHLSNSKTTSIQFQNGIRHPIPKRHPPFNSKAASPNIISANLIKSLKAMEVFAPVRII